MKRLHDTLTFFYIFFTDLHKSTDIKEQVSYG